MPPKKFDAQLSVVTLSGQDERLEHHLELQSVEGINRGTVRAKLATRSRGGADIRQISCDLKEDLTLALPFDRRSRWYCQVVWVWCFGYRGAM